MDHARYPYPNIITGLQMAQSRIYFKEVEEILHLYATGYYTYTYLEARIYKIYDEYYWYLYGIWG